MSILHPQRYAVLRFYLRVIRVVSAFSILISLSFAFAAISGGNTSITFLVTAVLLFFGPLFLLAFAQLIHIFIDIESRLENIERKIPEIPSSMVPHLFRHLVEIESQLVTIERRAPVSKGKTERP